MTINVYKSDFLDFDGLYDAVVYLQNRITSRCANFVEVDFGREHMNPYTIMENPNIKGRNSYQDLMRMCADNDRMEPYLVNQVYTLINMYEFTVDEIVRRVIGVTCWPKGHINRTLLS